MEKIPFAKFSGAGNDFIIIDKNQIPEFIADTNLIIKMCSRGTGIGADGLLIFSETDNADYILQYFNSDGSTGSLCGNASRCSVQYAKLKGIVKKSAEFIFCGCRYNARINEDDTVTVNMQDATDYKEIKGLSFNGVLIDGSYINTGSKHFVINIDEFKKIDKYSDFTFENFPVFEVGKTLRNSSIFSPEGVNVNFISVNNNEIKIRTFEKGVENETLACGTGAVAAAVVSFHQKKIIPPVTLIPKSQDSLIINFDYISQSVKNISLTGPAVLVFAGEYLLTNTEF